MKKESMCQIAEILGEAFLGGAIGIITRKTILPKCNKHEQLIVCLGSLVICGMVGRSFGKGFYKMCDNMVGTNICEENNL